MCPNQPLAQEVKSGTYAEALAAVSPSAQQPPWIQLPSVKYLSSSAPPRELGLKLNQTAPAVWKFAAGDGSVANAWGAPRAYAFMLGESAAPACCMKTCFLKKRVF